MENGPSEYNSIARRFAAAEKKKGLLVKKDKPSAGKKGYQPITGVENSTSIQFKASHLLVIVFFLWIFILHSIGLYFFTKGFLLTRLVLDHKSECSPPLLNVDNGSGCWYPKQFDKAVIIIVDALRYDFTVPTEDIQHYHNALTVLHETSSLTPHDAFLLPFIADPPTTTLQRLKALTSGTLPTFIDLGSSFSGTAIEEDNLLAQLRTANKTLVHLGDDTWQSLFPGYFDANLTHSYDSFNVWDLHTVDNGVTEHLLPLLRPENTTKWDVIFGHYLGVDHAGHRYGPDHAAMAAKLRQMDDVLRQIIKALDEQTLLVVMGDHGMDAKGDHGGESDDEVAAALWMYSKKGVFGRTRPEYVSPPVTAKIRPVGQIDLVPTLSLLLGMPIPFNNLGAPIDEAFIGPKGVGWKDLATVNALAANQIQNYQHEYAIARGLDQDAISEPRKKWNRAKSLWDEVSAAEMNNLELVKAASTAFSGFQSENLQVCKSLWARFDIPSMVAGITVLALGVVIILLFARSGVQDITPTIPSRLIYIGIGSVAGVLFGAIFSVATSISSLNPCLIGFVTGGICAYSWFGSCSLHGSLNPFPTTIFSWFAVIATLSPSIGFASNSYTIWEDEIFLFFLGTFGFLAVISSLRQANSADRVLGTYHCVAFLLLTRGASLSRLCREEQMPFCRSTYYASATSSTSATWQLLIPYILAILLPSIIKSFYQGTKSYEGSASFWLGFAMRIGLLGSAIYWTLDAADDGEWFGPSIGYLKTIRVVVAQAVLGIAFAAGTSTFVWAPPCVRIESTRPEIGEGRMKKSASVTILGYANVHGSRYFLLVSTWLLAVVLVSKPMGGGAIGLLGWQILALLEIIDTNDLSQSSIGPIVLGLLGNYYFFKTGHQATLASIQWDSAFVALKTIKYPWSPLLVVLNTFGAQILAAIAVPLVVLWKQPPKKQNLLSDVAKAMATHLSFYSVVNLATSMWAGHLRRHLMLYRIFSPRFMTGATVLVAVDLTGILVALIGFRWNLLSVVDVFGWE